VHAPHTYTHIRACIFMYACTSMACIHFIHTYIYVYMQSRTSIIPSCVLKWRVHIYIHAFIHENDVYIPVHVYSCLRVHARMSVYEYVCECMHIYMCIRQCVYMCTDAYMQAFVHTRANDLYIHIYIHI